MAGTLLSHPKKEITPLVATWMGLVTGDEMAGWHHRLSGHEFEQTLGDSEEKGSLACCSPWGQKESDTTE